MCRTLGSSIGCLYTFHGVRVGVVFILFGVWDVSWCWLGLSGSGGTLALLCFLLLLCGFLLRLPDLPCFPFLLF